MITALAWGIDPALAAGLARRIDGLAVDQVNDPFDIFRSLASRDYELLLLGDAPGRGLALDVLRDLRSRGGRVPIRVACCLDRGLDGEISSRTIADMGIDRIFFRPLDVEEIALQLARLLGAQLLPAPAGAREDPAASALDAVWARFREPTLRRVDVIEGAVLALLEGNLDREQQRLAEREAQARGLGRNFRVPAQLGACAWHRDQIRERRHIAGRRTAAGRAGPRAPGRPRRRAQRHAAAGNGRV